MSRRALGGLFPSRRGRLARTPAGGALLRGRSWPDGFSPETVTTATVTHTHTLPTPSSLHSATHTMASQRSARALRIALRQASAPRVQQRTFVSAVNAASRPAIRQAAVSSFVQQSRGAKTVDFAGDKEKVFGRLHETAACFLNT